MASCRHGKQAHKSRQSTTPSQSTRKESRRPPRANTQKAQAPRDFSSAAKVALDSPLLRTSPLNGNHVNGNHARLPTAARVGHWHQDWLTPHSKRKFLLAAAERRPSAGSGRCTAFVRAASAGTGFRSHFGFPGDWSTANKVNNFGIATGGHGVADNPERAVAVQFR